LKAIEINGKKIDVIITKSVEPDYHTKPEGDFDFGDKEENAAYLARFHSGELMMALVSVKASALGFEGTDCLGACHIKSDSDAWDIASEYNMVENAMKELRDNIVEAANKLKEYST